MATAIPRIPHPNQVTANMDNVELKMAAIMPTISGVRVSCRA